MTLCRLPSFTNRKDLDCGRQVRTLTELGVLIHSHCSSCFLNGSFVGGCLCSWVSGVTSRTGMGSYKWRTCISYTIHCRNTCFRYRHKEITTDSLFILISFPNSLSRGNTQLPHLQMSRASLSTVMSHATLQRQGWLIYHLLSTRYTGEVTWVTTALSLQRSSQRGRQTNPRPIKMAFG